MHARGRSGVMVNLSWTNPIAVLILPIAPLEIWPDGDIDLRGRAWWSLTAGDSSCRMWSRSGLTCSVIDGLRYKMTP